MLKNFTLFFFGFSFLNFAQTNPCVSKDEKFKKLLLKAIYQSSFDKQTEKFNSILSKYPNNAEGFFTFARITMAESKNKSKSGNNIDISNLLKKKSLYLYQTTIIKCPKFHAECYYEIASALLSEGETTNALAYYKKFIEFQDSDINAIPQDFPKKKKEIITFIEQIEFNENLINNPVPFSPLKIENVSSELDEYFPMISPDNAFLFFSRKVDRANLGDIGKNVQEEFSISTRLGNTEFSFGEPLSKPFNDGHFKNYGSATLALDNKEMIICACRTEKIYTKDYLNCDLYSTTYRRLGNGKNDFSWTPLINLGPNINTNDGWEAQPSLSADGKELFFTSSRIGSRDNDIYHSTRQKDGSWGLAKSFDVINTDGKDKSPFFHQDGQTLYFVSSSSKDRKGLGGLDIFYIRKEGENWSAAKNIGFPINSEQDELGLFVSTDGKTAYFSSFIEGNWNIYGFNLYEDARPNEIVLIKGELVDENGNGIKNASITVSYNDTGENKIVDVNDDDGKYVAIVDVSKKQDVTISVNKKDFAYNGFVLNVKELENSKNATIQLGQIKLDTLIKGKAYNLSDLFFETESYELNKKSLALLLGFTNYLQENTEISIAINGHTDDIGDDEKNLLLSQNRADAVKDYLLEKGIAANRLKSVGYGESKPSVPNSSEINRSRNRRTEFQILDIEK